jgi:hypothetical protein
MINRVIHASAVSAIAAAGSAALGLGPALTLFSFAIPIVFAILDVMLPPILSLFLLFGTGALVWSLTPISVYLNPVFESAKHGPAQAGTKPRND